MKLRPDQLDNHAQKNLLPVYLISGDVPLIQQEVCDKLRGAANSQGYTERELFSVEKGFDWNNLIQSASSISLFGDRKIIELRMPTGKPGDAGSKALQAYLVDPSPDNILIITTGKLDAASQRGKWFKTIDKMGAFIPIWPVDAKQLPQWVNQRMRSIGLEPVRQAVQVLAERVEGNLLAASQEIEKLHVLKGNGPISAKDIEFSVADSARYDVFGLVDAALEGNAQRSLKILDGLKDEGTDATVVLWAFTRELRTLYAMTQQKEKGIAIGKIIQEYRIWQNRKKPVEACLQRNNSQLLGQLIQKATEVDHSIKGLKTASPWDGLRDIALGLSGIHLTGV
ncbi:MAG: DNA polymerase III subunit delta [Pseudomonadales bacterium]|nr:DNA polymerase III subunit delta [Pseudomonadales bacterium]